MTVGKAFVSKTLPILVEDMSFTGRMKVRMRLSANFPHVKMVSVQFLEAPEIDYALNQSVVTPSVLISCRLFLVCPSL